MDIVNFWQQQVNKWNTDNKCGFCWDFGAPLTESAVNIQQPANGKECCVKVLLVRDKVQAFSTQNTYNDQTGLLTGIKCNTGFQLLFLMNGDMGTNNYNEIKGHDTNESKWATILSRLEDCIACDANIDFCDFTGSIARVTTWSANQVINYMDGVYSGYRLTVTFQNIR